jgi:hypothetical protein
MTYIRLVLYEGRMFHSGYVKEGDFGERDGERRLTFNVFVSPAS